MPDERLLYSNNPDDVLTYQRQDAAYQRGLAQQHQLQQEIARAQQEAAQARWYLPWRYGRWRGTNETP